MAGPSRSNSIMARTGSASPPPRPGVALYRTFLPAQPNHLSASDAIPPVADLGQLSSHLRELRDQVRSRMQSLDAESKALRDTGPTGLRRSARHAQASRRQSSALSPPPPTTSSSSSRGFSALQDVIAAEVQTPTAYAALGGDGLAGGSSRGKDKAMNLVSPSPSPAPGAKTSKKIKVKRSPEVERSASAAPAAIPSAATPLPKAGASAAAEATRGAIDVDMDDDIPPQKPGRTYGRHRKRARDDDEDDDDVGMSGSDAGTPPPRRNGSSAMAASASRGRQSSALANGAGTPGASGSQAAASFKAGDVPLGIKLKLNPASALQARVQRRVSETQLGSPFSRRSSVMQPYHTSSVPTANPSAWMLPKVTPHTFLPSMAATRLPRRYPVKPVEVETDFAAMDWKERERERDRLEAAAGGAGHDDDASHGATNGTQKESAAAGRARAQRQEQTQHHQFQSYTDAYFRTVTEDDLAWFSSKNEDHDLFVIPPLGRHYTEQWEEMDARAADGFVGGPAVAPAAMMPPGFPALLPATPTTPDAPLANGALKPGQAQVQLGDHLDIPPAPAFDPRSMKDEHSYGTAEDEARGGPLSERLLAAIMPVKMPPPGEDEEGAGAGFGQDHRGVNGAGTSSQPNRPSGLGLSLIEMNGSGANRTKGQDMRDFEQRLRDELKALDVVGEEEIDWSRRQDDEISRTLRMAQQSLARQKHINQQRKARLFDIAMDRMAYQDYMACLSSVEKEIENGWMKRQAAIRRAQMQKKKKGGAASSHANANGAASAGTPSGGEAAGTSSPAPAGANGSQAPTSSTSNNANAPIKPQFSEQLIAAMERRRTLRFAFEPMFSQSPHAWTTPRESVFADLDK